MSSLNVAVVLTLIAGLGGALSGAYVFRAPFWALPLFGIGGLFMGLIGAIVQNQIRVRFLEKGDEEHGKDFGSVLRFIAKLVLPFVAVIFVTVITVSAAVAVTRAAWPDLEPRDLGGLEKSL